jgi:HEAT repeat protein
VVARDAAVAARALERRLYDRDAGVRRAAAAALGRLGMTSPDVIGALTEAAGSDDEALARAARGALARLTGRASAGE